MQCIQLTVRQQALGGNKTRGENGYELCTIDQTAMEVKCSDTFTICCLANEFHTSSFLRMKVSQ